jgi:hypothetical protein
VQYVSHQPQKSNSRAYRSFDGGRMRGPLSVLGRRQRGRRTSRLMYIISLYHPHTQNNRQKPAYIQPIGGGDCSRSVLRKPCRDVHCFSIHPRIPIIPFPPSCLATVLDPVSCSGYVDPPQVRHCSHAPRQVDTVQRQISLNIHHRFRRVAGGSVCRVPKDGEDDQGSQDLSQPVSSPWFVPLMLTRL